MNYSDYIFLSFNFLLHVIFLYSKTEKKFYFIFSFSNCSTSSKPFISVFILSSSSNITMLFKL